MTDPFEIFLVATPGLETALTAEAREKGFLVTSQIKGGTNIKGTWADVYRANLQIRGATRVLARIGEFRVMHLAQLDKRSRKFPWAEFLRPDRPLRVEATCTKSKIYHAGAAAQRVETAVAETLGATVTPDALLTLKVRIEDDLCSFSLDTSGVSLHKRGFKAAVNKAPMRETMAAMFLRMCDFDGREPIYDPMCGSGTFPIEAAEIAAQVDAGRGRAFAFQDLANFDAVLWDDLKSKATPITPKFTYYGSDRDAGAIKMSQANAIRAGVDKFTRFDMKPISDATAPDGPKGLVIINPPYGGRIGASKPLYGLYAALGTTLKTNFKGWRVGMITSDAGLAKTTGLPFAKPGAPIDHGGIKVKLFKTGKLT